MRIVRIVPADPRWRAVFGTGEDAVLSRVVAWALTDDDEDDEQSVVGLVVDPRDPGRIVPAPDCISTESEPFTRYGFRGDEES